MPHPDDADDSTSIADSARENAPAADSLVSADDILLHDEDGGLKVKTVHVERLGGEVRVEPLLNDEYESIIAPFVNDPNTNTITDEEVAQLIDSHLVEPDLSTHAPGGRITAEFVAENISHEQQLAFVEAMCRAGGHVDAAKMLAGGIPESQQDIIIRAMASDEIDLSEVEQGNQTRR